MLGQDIIHHGIAEGQGFRDVHFGVVVLPARDVPATAEVDLADFLLAAHEEEGLSQLCPEFVHGVMKGVGDDGEVAGEDLLEPLLPGENGLVEAYARRRISTVAMLPKKMPLSSRSRSILERVCGRSPGGRCSNTSHAVMQSNLAGLLSSNTSKGLVRSAVKRRWLW